MAVCRSSASLVSVEEPHVLDGDDRLVGEGLEERDLPFGERADLVPQERDHTQRHILAKQWHRQRRAMASVLSLEHLAFRELVIWHGADVVNVDGASVDERSPRD